MRFLDKVPGKASKWPHESEQYPIKCSNCKHGTRTKKYQHCHELGIVFGLRVAFQECKHYSDKRKRGNQSNAEKTNSQTKPQNMETRRKSQQTKPQTVTRRDSNVKPIPGNGVYNNA